MTLVVAVSTSTSLWMLTDRRLSFPRSSGRKAKDDGVKVFTLDATDGTAFVGYAGLGMTAGNEQISDWLARVLRGRTHTVEQSLNVIAAAAKAEMPKHLRGLVGGSIVQHSFIAAAQVNQRPRMYSMNVAVDVVGKRIGFWADRHGNKPGPPQDHRRDLLVCIAGTGASILQERTFGNWRREVIRLIRAHDRAVLSSEAVAAHLARLCARVHETEKTVGPRCIVAWKVPGKNGGHAMFTDGRREHDVAPIPTIAAGIRVDAIAEVFIRLVEADGIHVDQRKLTHELAKLPEGPDERLR